MLVDRNLVGKLAIRNKNFGLECCCRGHWKELASSACRRSSFPAIAMRQGAQGTNSLTSKAAQGIRKCPCCHSSICCSLVRHSIFLSSSVFTNPGNEKALTGAPVQVLILWQRYTGVNEEWRDWFNLIHSIVPWPKVQRAGLRVLSGDMRKQPGHLMNRN